MALYHVNGLLLHKIETKSLSDFLRYTCLLRPFYLKSFKHPPITQGVYSLFPSFEGSLFLDKHLEAPHASPDHHPRPKNLLHRQLAH